MVLLIHGTAHYRSLLLQVDVKALFDAQQPAAAAAAAAGAAQDGGTEGQREPGAEGSAAGIEPMESEGHIFAMEVGSPS